MVAIGNGFGTYGLAEMEVPGAELLAAQHQVYRPSKEYFLWV